PPVRFAKNLSATFQTFLNTLLSWQKRTTTLATFCEQATRQKKPSRCLTRVKRFYKLPKGNSNRLIESKNRCKTSASIAVICLCENRARAKRCKTSSRPSAWRRRNGITAACGAPPFTFRWDAWPKALKKRNKWLERRT